MSGVAKSAMKKVNQRAVWLGHKETWPIIAAIAAAVGWLGYNAVVNLTMHPEVHWNRQQRGSMVKTNEEECDAWANKMKSRQRPAENDVANVGVFEDLNKRFGGGHSTTARASSTE